MCRVADSPAGLLLGPNSNVYFFAAGEAQIGTIFEDGCPGAFIQVAKGGNIVSSKLAGTFAV